MKMQPEIMNHADLVKALSKPGHMIKEDMSPMQAELIHMAVGVSGEAGELLDAIKKYTIYQKSLDIDNLIEELGDLEFYMERIRQLLNIHRETTLKENIKKLSKRYSEGRYSNDAAQRRSDKR